jgi:hypothetical protein
MGVPMATVRERAAVKIAVGISADRSLTSWVAAVKAAV